LNSVSRSGDNEFSGSLYYQFRNQGLVGKKAGDLSFNPGTFKYGNGGGWLSGPIIKNKLFYFVSYEKEALTQPGTTYRANTGGEPVGGNVTRVLASDLDQLSTYLQNNFSYATGAYQGYSFQTPATRFLAKIDYNFSDRNKLSLALQPARFLYRRPRVQLLLARVRQQKVEHRPA